MATFGVFQPAIPTKSPVDYATDAFSRGYQALAPIGQAYKRGKYAEALGETPEGVTTTQDTQQSRMLAEQTEGMAIPENEKQLQASTQQTTTTYDWAKQRSKVLKAAARAGKDPMEADKEFDNMLHRRFMSSLDNAIARASAGDMQGAQRLFQEAYGYLPDGQAGNVQLVKGPDGQPTLMGTATDEETGKTVGAMMLTPQNMLQFREMMSDPAKFSATLRDKQYLDKEHELKSKEFQERLRKNQVSEAQLWSRISAEWARMETPEERKAQLDLIKAQIAKYQAEAKAEGTKSQPKQYTMYELQRNMQSIEKLMNDLNDEISAVGGIQNASPETVELANVLRQRYTALGTIFEAKIRQPTPAVTPPGTQDYSGWEPVNEGFGAPVATPGTPRDTALPMSP